MSVIQHPMPTDNPKTIQCGIQTTFLDNVEKTPNIEMLKQEKKRIKRKQYKRRKKDRQIQLQNELKIELRDIIDSVYTRKAKFQVLQQRVYEVVCVISNTSFRQFLDHVIRQQRMQRQFWQYMQSIMQQNPFSKGSNHVFYCLMINEIYQKYKDIQQSSYEIEKIINLHLKQTFNTVENNEEFIYQNLAINTFKYMVNTDQSLKNLIYLCQQKVPHTESQRHKVEYIVEMVANLPIYNVDDDDDEYEGSYVDERQTSISEEDENYYYEKKKKRKRKIKDIDLSTQYEDVMNRINSLCINTLEQQQCPFTQDWLHGMQNRLVYFQKK